MDNNEGQDKTGFSEDDGRDTADSISEGLTFRARVEGKIPWSYEAKFSEADLPAERLRQANLYIKLGFHTEIDPNMTPQEYINSLPQFESPRNNTENGFTIPLLVETRISIKKQAELAGLHYRATADTERPGIFIEGEFVDWADDPKGYKTPDNPYTVWVRTGERDERSIQIIRQELLKDERGGTVYDGIALSIVHPDILLESGITLPGTQLKGSSVGRAAAIHIGRSGTDLFGEYIGNKSLQFKPLICKRINPV